MIDVGTVGALALSLLRLHSPSRIVAYRVREEELDLARRLGATEVVLAGTGVPAHEDLDLVVETAGARWRSRSRRSSAGRAGGPCCSRSRARDAR